MKRANVPDQFFWGRVAERDRLKELLRQCVDELEYAIEAKYPPHMLEYPHNQQKKKNDRELVVKARAALKYPIYRPVTSRRK